MDGGGKSQSRRSNFAAQRTPNNAIDTRFRPVAKLPVDGKLNECVIIIPNIAHRTSGDISVT